MSRRLCPCSLRCSASPRGADRRGCRPSLRRECQTPSIALVSTPPLRESQKPMQIARVRIQKFKGIDDLDLSFEDDGVIRPLTVLIGDNGSGKTTVLQAVALVLSLATKQTSEPALLDWPGFKSERTGDARIAVEVVMDEDERQHLHGSFAHAQPTSPALSLATTDLGAQGRVQIVYEGGRLRSQIPRADALGSVIWFDQNRSLSTMRIDRMRDCLVSWWAIHTSPHRTEETDYLGQLERRFAELFPGTRFRGVEPKLGHTTSSTQDSHFLLEREGRVYDIAEMSGGEQAVFPLLFEFVRVGIARSIVLIDALELHLHPPQQQTLLTTLSRIGCQFIVTTHSPYLEQITPDEDKTRLPGGRRCL